MLEISAGQFEKAELRMPRMNHKFKTLNLGEKSPFAAISPDKTVLEEGKERMS